MNALDFQLVNLDIPFLYDKSAKQRAQAFYFTLIAKSNFIPHAPAPGSHPR